MRHRLSTEGDKIMLITKLLLDMTTHEHSQNTARLAAELGKKLGLESKDVEKLIVAGTYHDIGKTLIPREILSKPGPLSFKEYACVQRHAIYGADILSSYGYDEYVVNAVLHHHEGWDGLGYPSGISGLKIPLFARILHICDSFDAMTSSRPYRKLPYTYEQAFRQLYIDEGIDKELLKIFVDIFEYKELLG